MASEAAIQNYYPAESTNDAAHRAGVAMIAVFSVGFSFSYGPISWIYASEVFPNHIRHIGVAASVRSTLFLSELLLTCMCHRPALLGLPMCSSARLAPWVSTTYVSINILCLYLTSHLHTAWMVILLGFREHLALFIDSC